MEDNKRSGRGLHDYAHLFLSRKADAEKYSDTPSVSSLQADTNKVHDIEMRRAAKNSTAELHDSNLQVSPAGIDQGLPSSVSSPLKQEARQRPYAIALACNTKSIASSFLTFNLCIDFAGRGQRMLVLNSDLSFPSMNLFASLKRGTPQGATGASTNTRLITLDMDLTILYSLWAGEQNPIVHEISTAAKKAGVILINTSMAFSANAKAILKASDDCILISGTEPARLIETYSMIKTITRISPESPIGVIITAPEEEAFRGFKKLDEAARQFLGKSLAFCGFLRWDADVIESVRNKMPLPADCPVARQVHAIGELLLNRKLEQQKLGDAEEPAFLEKLFVTSGQAMVLPDSPII